MLELILSKKSSESEIKSYFNAVLELSKSDNEFPINLDEVWMLVYGRKEEAVRALTSSEQFIENIDYQVLRKNAENQKGGRPTNEYKLTVSCMEFFIARKVRPVFEVYRQVFHKVAKHELSRKELALRIKREFPCLQAGDNSAFVHTFFWFKSPTHGAWESKACGLS